MKKQQGFTLIEVIIYLALFTILMGGTITTAYSVFDSSDRDQARTIAQEEGDFLIAKINWALSGTKNINISSSTELFVEKRDASGTATTTIYLSGTDFYLSRGSNPPVLLNNSNVEVSNLVFARSGSIPERVQATFKVSARTLNGMVVSQNFFTVKYLRK